MCPTLLRRRNDVTDSQNRSGSVGAEHPTEPATSSEFAVLLTKVAPNTQSLCVAASGNEVSSLPRVEIENDMSLRALVDCEASNNFVQYQLLDNSKLKYIEREIPPTKITVRLATGAFVPVMEHVVKITYTLRDVK